MGDVFEFAIPCHPVYPQIRLVLYLVRLKFAEPCEPAFWDAASASVEGVT